MEYQPLYTPGSLSESAFIESLLGASGIRYFIKNDNFARMYPGTQRTFYVHPDDYIAAREVLKELQREPIPPEVLEQLSVIEPPLERSTPEQDAESRSRIFGITVLVILACYTVYKIISSG